MSQDAQRAAALAAFGPTLAIDSSQGTAVAVSNGTDITIAFEDDPLAHAEVIGVLIERALNDAGLTAVEIEHVVIGVGPGPFTGLRVGIAAAHGFAAGIGCEPLGVLSHDAVSVEYFREHPERSDVVVVTDARRKELFTTRYRAADDGALPSRSAGPELKPAADYDDESHPDALLLLRPTRISAAALIEVAALRAVRSEAQDPARAVYLRSPDVTMPGAPKRVSS